MNERIWVGILEVYCETCGYVDGYLSRDERKFILGDCPKCDHPLIWWRVWVPEGVIVIWDEVEV